MRGKLRDLIEAFCEDLLDPDKPAVESLANLWPLLEREFLLYSLNENNLYELTFLAGPAYDRDGPRGLLQVEEGSW